MPDPRAYQTLEFTPNFWHTFTRLSQADQRRVLRALEKLDTDEHTPSLYVHELQGQDKGVWSAAASKSLRITFERLGAGRKLLLACSQHYGN
jgi:mRNA-degrading endonuclease YafQ of YafQ-DinJ toxin-antitoxin module